MAGVIGWPIGHSLSPCIHRFWAEAEGANAHYIPVEVEPDFSSFKKSVDGLRAAEFAGVNVTAPHKENALRYADEASDIALNAGAANMLTFGDRVRADNSDATGFSIPLNAALSGKGSKETSVLILGAGGAARGIIAGLINQFKDITVTNRSGEKAEILAEKFDLKTHDWATKDDAIAAAQIVINTTTLGSLGQPPLEIPPEHLGPNKTICDIIYNPLQTPLLEVGAARGSACIDGLAMLMHQAVPGYQAWLGKKAEVNQSLREHVLKTLRERTQS